MWILGVNLSHNAHTELSCHPLTPFCETGSHCVALAQNYLCKPGLIQRDLSAFASCLKVSITMLGLCVVSETVWLIWAWTWHPPDSAFPVRHVPLGLVCRVPAYPWKNNLNVPYPPGFPFVLRVLQLLSTHSHMRSHYCDLLTVPPSRRFLKSWVNITLLPKGVNIYGHYYVAFIPNLVKIWMLICNGRWLERHRTK